MQKHVLISGGSGLIGTEITKQLLEKGYEVSHFSRSKKKDTRINTFVWDVDKGTYDSEAFAKQPDYLINLAGAPINKRWTPEYKSEILQSRIDAIRLLFEGVHAQGYTPKAFVSTSAVGYYPSSLTDEYTEKSKPGNDFLSEVCIAWEREAKLFEKLDVRTAICRVGIVLASNSGALPAIVKPIKFGLGAPLASGEQWMPWIHVKDVAKAFIEAMENKDLKGAVNAVGPYNVTNKQLTKAAADVLKKPLFLPKVPAFALKLALGEMAETALSSNKVLNKKLSSVGFNYQFEKLEDALKDLLG